jgi:hypothetical protein
VVVINRNVAIEGCNQLIGRTLVLFFLTEGQADDEYTRRRYQSSIPQSFHGFSPWGHFLVVAMMPVDPILPVALKTR